MFLFRSPRLLDPATQPFPLSTSSSTRSIFKKKKKKFAAYNLPLLPELGNPRRLCTAGRAETSLSTVTGAAWSLPNTLLLARAVYLFFLTHGNGIICGICSTSHVDDVIT